MKERLLLKKDREQRGREKEGEALRLEEFSEEKLRVTVWLWEVRGTGLECVCLSSAVDTGNVHALCRLETGLKGGLGAVVVVCHGCR